jgi:glutamate 5-kinase
MSNRQPRIVVRIEIATLCNEDGKLDRKKMDKLAMVLSNLRNSGKDILVISSGAIALGSEKLKYDNQPKSLIEMQATAAIGQAELIRFYQIFFEEYNQIVAQVLLTSDITDFKDREQNARNTFDTLLEMNIIPIINENDPISTTDIELNDNYPLALKVARIANADIMVLKLETDGKYLIIQKNISKAIIAEDEYKLFERIDEIIKYHSKAVISDEDFPVSVAGINF